MASVQAGEETNSFEETILVREKKKILRLVSVFRRAILEQGYFNVGCKMTISVQNPMLKVNYFLKSDAIEISKLDMLTLILLSNPS